MSIAFFLPYFLSKTTFVAVFGLQTGHEILAELHVIDDPRFLRPFGTVHAQIDPLADLGRRRPSGRC